MGFSLKSLTTKNSVRGSCNVIHAPGGVGKSTLCAQIAQDNDGVIILGEDGLSPLGFDDVVRTNCLSSWGEFQEMLQSFALDEHEFKTVIIDTIDATMPMLQDYVVDKYYGGNLQSANSFKAMYTEMNSEFVKVLSAFKLMQSKGINVVVSVHSVVGTHRAPDAEPYQMYDLNLPGGIKTSLASLLFDYADNVLFLRRDIIVSDSKAVGGNRVIQTEWTPSYLAKSRTEAPEKMLLSYESYKKYFILN